jgi:hypothetical protein
VLVFKHHETPKFKKLVTVFQMSLILESGNDAYFFSCSNFLVKLSASR